MLVFAVVRAARMFGRASGRVLAARFDDALVDVVAVRFVQVPIVQVVDVVAVLEGLVPATGRVPVRVARVLLVVRHVSPPATDRCNQRATCTLGAALLERKQKWSKQRHRCLAIRQAPCRAWSLPAWHDP